MSYTCLISHLIFSTKNRLPFLRDKTLRNDVHAYLGGIIRNLGGTAITVGGVEDHVHLLVSLPARLAISDVIRTIKSNSTTWVRETRDSRPFAWQSEYAAFSVSASNVAEVAAYIDDQEEHHRKRTFQEELILLLQRHGVKYDERYIRPA